MSSEPGGASPPPFPKSDYREFPKTLPSDDFWGQVRRTIRGQRISEGEVGIMVAAIKANLDLQPTDVVLDLACGNGALSARLYDACAALTGVDQSEYLIEVAKANFERAPEFTFEVGDAASYVREARHADRFTKVLCYGSFSFFSAEDAEEVLDELGRRFTHVERVLLGNLPDRERATRFFAGRDDYEPELDDHTSQAGLWRSAPEIEALAARHGWRASFRHMPESWFNAHYRFDVVLERSEGTA